MASAEKIEYCKRSIFLLKSLHARSFLDDDEDEDKDESENDENDEFDVLNDQEIPLVAEQ